ncbi:MAG: nucleotidyltransferase domain-containing protein [Firmicutes bacterium]|nr:nucleotidyltransferase domain-containing protein [Bacillota bacterium]
MPEEAGRVTAVVSAYIAALRRHGIPAEKVYLFGSRARGDARPESDIDLILVSSAFSGMPAWKRWEVLGDALAEVLEPIEALAYSPEEFEAKKDRKASFLGHLLSQPEVVQFQPET